MKNGDVIVLGGGCFWCLDAAYRQVKGILKSEVGYSGGDLENPNYEQVCSGTTGYVEVDRLTFDPKIISLVEVLDIFWTLHDPTSRDAQGADVGSQYRSVIFYNSETQKQATEASVQKAQKLFDKPIVTTISPLKSFYLAEDYHQDYFNKNPSAGYCQFVINPKLNKLRAKFAAKLLS